MVCGAIQVCVGILWVVVALLPEKQSLRWLYVGLGVAMAIVGAGLLWDSRRRPG
jgi:hypothetical protein